MLVHALLQTSLVLWLAQRTLQGGVRPQTASFGRLLPGRGVSLGIGGVKPGGVGALEALGGRGYGSRKAGVGRYAGAHLGVGGYRGLGAAGRAGLKHGGYGAQAGYGAALGTGMGMALGAGLANGLGLALGQGAKRGGGYGGGFGVQPGYGALAGVGYPGARPGVGVGYPIGAKGPKPGVSGRATMGQRVQDLKKVKSRALVGKGVRTLGPAMLNVMGSQKPGGAAPQLQAGESFRNNAPILGEEIKSFDPVLIQGGTSVGAAGYGQGKGASSYGATQGARSPKPLMPIGKDKSQDPAFSQLEGARGFGSFPQNHGPQTYRHSSEVSGGTGIKHHASETQRAQRLDPQSPAGKDSKSLSPVTPQAHGDTFSQSQGARSFGPPLPQGQGAQISLPVAAETQGSWAPVGRDSLGLSSGAFQTRDEGYGPVTPDEKVGTAAPGEQASRGHAPGGQQAKSLSHVEPGSTLTARFGPGFGLGVGGIPNGQGYANGAGLAAGARNGYGAGNGALNGGAGVNGCGPGTRGPSEAKINGCGPGGSGYVGGNYHGAALGTGGYGAGLGHGGYPLGSAAGKLGLAAGLGQGGYPHGVAGKLPGYGDGAAGYLGAGAGNGFGGDAAAAAKAASAGYGNGYNGGANGYGAGLGYPAELADGAGRKAGKSEGLGAAGYAGQGHGAYGGAGSGPGGALPYGGQPVVPAGLGSDGKTGGFTGAMGLGTDSGLGALGAGMESTAGKYGGGVGQLPYAGAPVIPTGLDGDGSYPYGAQHLGLGADGGKAASKLGGGAGYGAQQTGYGAQLGTGQDAYAGQGGGKYGRLNGLLGNGYKG